MNVTEDEFKDRQLHEEGCLQIVSAEQKGYAGTSVHQRITENNVANKKVQTDNLMEKILHRDNLNRAFKKVRKNRGAGGVDGLSVDELLTFLREDQGQIIREIEDGRYKPRPVRRVEIPKEERGKVRELGIPTVVDRMIQQAITQVLSPIYEWQFSDSSFGFRPRRSTHDALKRCQELVNEGYVYAVDMDLEKFFDTVCQSKLIEILSRTVEDGRVVSLIHKYLNAGVVSHGMFAKTEVGVPQGGPLSPLLSNIMLNELDKELERRGHKFVRYADDCMILCKSRKSAERTLRNILPFIEGKLFLKVNREKTSVAHISKVKYLGYAVYRNKGKCRLRVHPKSLKKAKGKLRELTSRSNGWGNEYRAQKLTEFIRGWVNYFSLADMKTLLMDLDEWLRRRIRMIYWKQWKKIRTKFAMLKKLGIPESKAWEYANTRKGHWRTANSPVLKRSLTNERIARLGFISMTDYYLKIRVN